MTSTTRRDFLKIATAAPLGLAALNLANETTTAKAAASSNVSPAASTDKFDYVLAGGGHNSLVCAAYLATAGYRVVVLEGHAMIGGGCKTAEILLPGFKEDLCSSAHTVILKNPLLRDKEMDLAEYGYELIHPDVVIHYPFLDGASVTVFENDVERTAASIARLSKKDADTFRRVTAARAQLAGMAPADAATTRAGIYFQRLSNMTGFAAVNEIWESPYMRAASLSGGRFFGPLGSDYGTGLQAFSMMDHMRGRPIPKGGSGMLTVALGRYIEAHNGVILTNKPVVRLSIDGGRCTGVECADGTQYRADKGVVSTIHVKHLIEMAPRELWGDEFNTMVDAFQPEHAMIQFHYATTEAPQYTVASGGTISSTEAVLMDRPESVLLLNSYNARGEAWVEDTPLQ